MNAILEVKNLVKKYPSVTAVDGISFAIRPGICFGLLGPNGAGKTTTLEIIEGVTVPTSGEILYKGEHRTASFKEKTGIQFQSTEVLSFLTVRETLETFRAFYRHPMKTEEIIRRCRLEDILDRDNSKISGGQRQRLMLAMALVNDPELIFLDEPTTGLDPQARRHLWDIVGDIKKEGKTLVLTTHYMEEAQILCDEIAIIDHGKIIVQGTPEMLLSEHCSEVTLSLPKNHAHSPALEILSENRKEYRVCKLKESPTSYDFETDDINACIGELVRSGADLSRITVRSRNLEDLFIKLTGRRLRE